MELTGMSLVQVAAAIRQRQVSSSSAVEACLDRIARFDAATNAVVAVDIEGALRAAHAADRMIERGELSGPLHGVPLAHKDMFYRSGRESACGSRIRTGWICDETATVLRRLDRAGAIDIARLAMSEFALGPIGLNAHFGHARNPWDVTRVSGGSSSGPAISVAGGYCFGALGSDTGASIRVPAAACGITGLKPTRGLVSRAHTMPLSSTLDVIGPLARSTEDAALLLSCIAGRDDLDPETLSPDGEFIASLTRDIPLHRGMRIGIPRGYFAEDVHPEIAARLAEVADSFRRMDIRPVDVDDSLFADASRLYASLLGAEATRFHRPWMSTRPEDYSPHVRSRLEAAARVGDAHYREAQDGRVRLIQALDARVFAHADIVLAPIWSRPPPTLASMDAADAQVMAATVGAILRPTQPVNVLGLPALALPCRPLGDGMPCGFQLIGPALSEPMLLALGRRFQRETDWHLRTPDWS